MSADHCEHCHHKKTHHCGQCGKHDCECSEKSHKHKEEAHFAKICCLPGPMGPMGPRGPRGRPAVVLPSIFRELSETFPIPIGTDTAITPLTVVFATPVATEVRVIATASPDVLSNGAPIQLIFRIRIDGVLRLNGAAITINRDVVGRPQRASASIVHSSIFTPGIHTVDLVVNSDEADSFLNPFIGGATLLIERQ